MQLVNGIDPGVSKTQPLATFLHRSAVIALFRSAFESRRDARYSIVPQERFFELCPAPAQEFNLLIFEFQ
jgi:hypothetical protein